MMKNRPLRNGFKIAANLFYLYILFIYFYLFIFNSRLKAHDTMTSDTAYHG